MKALRADAPVRIQPPETCPHDRVYTWFPRLIVNDPKSPTIACHGCCDCGTGWTTLPSWAQKIAGYEEPLREALS